MRNLKTDDNDSEIELEIYTLNMTEEDIQTLALSIATALDAPIDFVGEYEMFLRELLRRYCLVEKEAVRKEYHEIKLALGDGGRSEWEDDINEDDINMEKDVLLKSPFP